MNMDYAEIKKQYSSEWVLIEYDELDEDLRVKNGNVIAHSPLREEVYKALGQTVGKNVAVEYLGPIQSDLTVMFFYS